MSMRLGPSMPGVPRSGRGGRRFKSCHSDQIIPNAWRRSVDFRKSVGHRFGHRNGRVPP
jgi:hypothetical protein